MAQSHPQRRRRAGPGPDPIALPLKPAAVLAAVPAPAETAPDATPEPEPSYPDGLLVAALDPSAPGSAVGFSAIIDTEQALSNAFKTRRPTEISQALKASLAALRPFLDAADGDLDAVMARLSIFHVFRLYRLVKGQDPIPPANGWPLPPGLEATDQPPNGSASS